MEILEKFNNLVETSVILSSGIAPDKRGVHIIFLISPQKGMLWVLIRSVFAEALLMSTRNIGFGAEINLTLVLLNPDISCLCKQC